MEAEGRGFLQHTGSILAGTLLEAGRGRIDEARVDEVLATRNRRLAGQTLPPQGLCLRWIHYGDTPLPPGFPEPYPGSSSKQPRFRDPQP